MLRRDVSRIIPLVSILLTPLLGLAAGDSDLPDRERIHHSYESGRKEDPVREHRRWRGHPAWTMTKRGGERNAGLGGRDEATGYAPRGR